MGGLAVERLAQPAVGPRARARAAALAGVFVGVVVGVVASAPAQAQPAAAETPLPAAEARQWLARVQQAARSGNYEGTLVYSAGGQLTSSQVRHYRVGEQTYELLESMDGRQHRIVRHNDLVQTVWPGSRVAVVERRETLPAWGTTPQSVDPLALESYELRLEGASRVAGREAQVVRMQPRDMLRYAQRLWADVTTGLMLRADVLAPAADGRPDLKAALESHAFSEIELGVKPRPERVTQWLNRLEGYQVSRPQQQRTTLEAEGWAVARPVKGFTLAGCLKRGMATAGEAAPVMQAVFTDGLTHVSVFVEPFQPERHRQELHAQRGATATLTARRDVHWVTVVGDVPVPTLRLFADALERRTP
jgi:sigma-E factor negative regulatory protein RseB